MVVLQYSSCLLSFPSCCAFTERNSFSEVMCHNLQLGKSGQWENPHSLRTLKHRLRDLFTVSQSAHGSPGPCGASEPGAMRHGKSSVTPTSFCPLLLSPPNSTGRNSYTILRKRAKERRWPCISFPILLTQKRLNSTVFQRWVHFIKDKFFLVCYSLGRGKLSTKKRRYFSQHGMKGVHHCDWESGFEFSPI